MTRKTSFYYSFLVLPKAKREAITAVFDFCRAVDDSVDLETDPARAQAALATWRAEVARVFDQQQPLTPQTLTQPPRPLQQGKPRKTLGAPPKKKRCGWPFKAGHTRD